MRTANPIFEKSPPFYAYLMIFLTTFSVYSIELPGGIGLTPVNLFNVVVFPLLLFHCLIQNRIPDISAIGLFHLLYIGVSAAGLLFAVDAFGVLKFTGSYALEYFISFLVILFFINTREQLEKAVKIFLITTTLNAIMGWVELFGFFFFHKMIFPPFADLVRGSALSAKNFGYGVTGAFSVPGFMRMFGFTGDGFGGIMIIPFGLCLYFASHKEQKRKKLLWFAAAFFALTTIISASRSGIIGSFIVFFISYIFKKNETSKPFPMVFNNLKLVLMFGSLLFIFYLMASPSIQSMETIKISSTTNIKTPLFLLNRMNPFVHRSFSKSQDYFTEHGRLALQYGLSNLGFGMGGENFDEYVFRYHPIRFGSHSNFILFLGDTGVWGFILQILIILGTLFYGAKTYIENRDDPLPLYLAVIFLGLVMTGIVRTFYLLPESFIISALVVKLWQLARSVPTPSLMREKNHAQ